MTKIKSLDELRQKNSNSDKAWKSGKKQSSRQLVQIKVAMATCGIASVPARL